MEIGELLRNARLPSPSPVVLTLYDVLEGGDAEEIANTIASDPALAARLLRLANSAFYGPPPVATVREAVVRVGTLEVAALVLATEVMRIFYGIPEGRFSMQSFWAHSLQTACLSRVLARSASVPSPEPLWVCGLLHDIGRLLLARQVPLEYGEVLDRVEAGTPLVDAEQAILGFTHAQVGAALLRAWRLPEVLAQCAAQHHEPYTALTAAESVVAAANDLANGQEPSDGLPGLTAAATEQALGEAAQLYARYKKLFAEYL